MAEQFANDAQTVLSAPAAPADVAVAVASAAAFPLLTPFRIVVGAEIMLVTAGAGTASWTVTRGLEATGAAAHDAGATVSQILTAGAVADFVALAEAAEPLPAVGDAGDVLTTVGGVWEAAAPPAVELPAVGDAGDVLTTVGGVWEAAAPPAGGGGGAGPVTSVTRGSSQNLPDSALTTLLWTIEETAAGWWDSGEPTRLTVDLSGWYLVTVHLTLSGPAVGRRSLSIRRDNSDYLMVDRVYAADTITDQIVTGLIELAVGEYIEALVFHASGGALSAQVGSGAPRMTLARLVG